MKNLLILLSFALVTAAVSFAGVDPVSAGIGTFATGAIIGSIQKSMHAQGALLMSIPVQDARSVFTKILVDVYKEKTSPTSFLRSFFPVETSMSKNISIQVQRGTEYVAVDVERGTNGNRNTFSKSTEKIFTPPFYWEYFNANEHELYEIAIGMQSADAFQMLTNDHAEKLMSMREKMERAYELQCAQVLLTGIVQLASDTNIDFKRKAGSLVDLTGSPWDNNANNPLDHLANGCSWVRQNGKSKGGRFVAIMAEDVFMAFKANTNVSGQADIRRFNMDDLGSPQSNSVGGVYHGYVSAGSYTVDIWTYPEQYQDTNGNYVDYITAKNVIILPPNPRFKMTFGAVPQLIENGSAPQRGEYLVQDFVDQRATNHEVHIKSAGVAIPVAVDQMYTAQVLS